MNNHIWYSWQPYMKSYTDMSADMYGHYRIWSHIWSTIYGIIITIYGPYMVAHIWDHMRTCTTFPCMISYMVVKTTIYGCSYMGDHIWLSYMECNRICSHIWDHIPTVPYMIPYMGTHIWDVYYHIWSPIYEIICEHILS